MDPRLKAWDDGDRGSAFAKSAAGIAGEIVYMPKNEMVTIRAHEDRAKTAVLLVRFPYRSALTVSHRVGLPS
jgi:hypothetical protein